VSSAKKTFRFRGKDRHLGLIVPHPSFHAQAHLHDVLKDIAVPTPPTTLDLTSSPGAQLVVNTMLGNGPDPSLPNGPDGNPIDPVGDCVIACDLHLAGIRAAAAGESLVPNTPEAICVYGDVTGYVPGNASTDQGTDPTALFAWRKTNAYPDGTFLAAAVPVDATNRTRLFQAIWLTSGCYGWASLPDGWQSEEDAGDVWDVAGDPNPSSGHGFALAGFGLTSEATPRIAIAVITWGEIVWLTVEAAAKYLTVSAGGGVAAPLDSNVVNAVSKLCPAGVDLSTLQSFLNAIAAPSA
jgi:hypothetical protein